MQLKDALTIFAKVGDAGSISGAARILNLPKARVSRAISRLEADFGVPLAERTSRRLILTQAGTKLHEHSKRLISEFAVVEAEMAEHRGEPSGTLMVGCSSSVAKHIAPFIKPFLERYPALTLKIRVADRVLPEPTGFDLVIHAGWLADSSLIARKLADVALVLVAAPSYLERAGRPERIEDLAAHAVIGNYYSDDPAATASEQLPARVPALVLFDAEGSHAIATSSPFATNDFRLLHEVVVGGLGIGTLPAIDADPDIRARRLERVLPGYSIAEPPALWAVHSGRAVAPKARAFMNFIGEKVLSEFGRAL